MSDVWAGRQNRPPGGPGLYERCVLDLLPRCPRLSAFAFETYAFSTLEPIIKALSDCRHLRHLEFRIFAGNSSHTAAIGSILAKHVDTLDLLSIQFRLLQEERWVTETAPPERLLRVKDLRIPHLTEGPADPLMRRFLDYIDGPSVYAFNADIQEARSQVLGWAATQCPRFGNLRLITVPSALRVSRPVLHRFKNFIWLDIHDVSPDTSVSDNGISLHDLLDQLPSNFMTAYFSPRAFDVPPDFPHVPYSKFLFLEGPTVCASKRVIDEEGKVGTAPFNLVKKRGADGVLRPRPPAPPHEAWTTAFFCSPSLDLEPFKHPVMPVPYLPIELVDLIISHVARDLTQSERLEECGRLALVCRNWTERARMVAWRELEVHVTNDAKLIDHLRQHPHLA
ncbi:Proteophosphoglycan ppg4 [Rhodotorula toruloides ATCC 204091]|uniref:Proteophosphoglycan ppg4 n=1 Tax=Rhodotorula toruloides TaxID=5286 RepID=A0A0K3CNJ9_RHOTO|nr:Proteophosphoglycan ppg4 [Rhodotorula toruloides ATCC 204091]PRQ71283.1 Proteophosphoglycan ppg4 [Rhodotorula toruloides]